MNVFSKFLSALKPDIKKQENPQPKRAEDTEEHKIKGASTAIHENNAQSWNKETHPKGSGPSKLVKEIHYDNRNGDDSLKVTYRDGFTAQYDDIDPEDVKQFIATDSKGRWALRNLWNKPYKGV